ncbi:MAG: class I SAM-dependent methyltransferase [Anaerotardibacter sp.]
MKSMTFDTTYSSSVMVLAEQESFRTEAEELATHLNATLLTTPPSKDFQGLVLSVGEKGLSLIDGSMTLHGDYVKMYDRIKPGKFQKELIVKAAKIKNADHPLTAIDATAGLGQDGLLLAAAGFQVTLYEKDPIIAALLKDSICRVENDRWLGPITQRMTVVEGDSIAALQSLDSESSSPDVILLDPMFPKRKKAASVKKKFQVIHQLEKPCENEEELLEAALKAHPRKIVIKRPAKSPYLGGISPTYSLEGKAIRYDVIALPPKA